METPPPSKKVAAVPESERVAFDLSAAGHEGISSNASGSLIIKPCTQAEIDFYESAKDHPLFQAHMPTFIGSLSEHDDQDLVAPLLDAANEGVAAPNGVVTSPTPGLIRRATWKPSGGKKISTDTAIVLENVASGFRHPNVLDVKLGARLWDDDSPVAKRQKLDEVSARTTSGSLGFRVAGMKIWAAKSQDCDVEVTAAEKEYVEVKNGYKSYNKFYGQSFKTETVVDAFTSYFGGVVESDDTAAEKKVKLKQKRVDFIIRRFIRELESVQYVLENEESRMFSASVLMVYEADEEALEESIANEEKEDAKAADSHEDAMDAEEVGEDDDDEDEDDEADARPRKIQEVRLIDFAHAKWTPGEGPDENALQGIRSVLKILKDLIA